MYPERFRKKTPDPWAGHHKEPGGTVSSDATYRPLLEAVAFAARAHRHQLRKDRDTPYASHVFRVCLVVREVFGIADVPTLTAAVLHDTIEDTTTDYDDLLERFGSDVASWVAALSKDKRLRDDEREAAYMRQLSNAPWQVKVCKLADVFDNLMDSKNARPEQREKVLSRAESYLEALRPNLPEPARLPYEITNTLFKEMELGGTPI
jgi:(p)ppGpp synthase/HD superfamily hydrolase